MYMYERFTKTAGRVLQKIVIYYDKCKCMRWCFEQDARWEWVQAYVAVGNLRT